MHSDSRRLVGCVLATVVCTLATTSARSAPPVYTVTDLGTLGTAADVSDARGINATGQVVGWSSVGGGADHAFLWSGGAMLDLGTLGGANSRATALNASGEVAGFSGCTDAFQSEHAFKRISGTLTDLGYLGGGATGHSSGLAINATGVVVGESEGRGFYADGGGMTLLPGGAGYYSSAQGISDQGVIVGWAKIDADQRACYWSALTPIDLGHLGGGTSMAHGIAQATPDLGSAYIVGESTLSSGGTHAFSVHGSVMSDLGALPGYPYSVARAVNSAGVVVGDSEVFFNGAGHGSVYVPGDGLYDLNDLLAPGTDWQIAAAYGINAAGQIVGRAGSVTLGTHAVLLTPAATAAVPRPADAPLAFSGAVPNPVTAGARFEWDLATPGPVRLELLDLAGRRVRTLANVQVGAGTGFARWDGCDERGARVGAGIYWARLEAGGRSVARRVAVVR